MIFQELRAARECQAGPVSQQVPLSWMERPLEAPPRRRAEDTVDSELQRAPSLLPSDYLLDINKALLAMADIELLLNSSELSSGLYEDFSSQEDALKVGLHAFFCWMNIYFFFTSAVRRCSCLCLCAVSVREP